MQHPMRRTDRALSDLEAREILARADHGVLATVDEDGWPYAVTVNHVLAGDLLYFHCAPAGHKLENILHDDRVSFTAVPQAEVLPQRLTTLYESAILFGRASLVEDPTERLLAMELLGDRFCPSALPEVEKGIRKDASRTAIVRIQIERITGKANR